MNVWVATKSFIGLLSDDTNQSTIFAYVGTARSLGMILGQILGGNNTKFIYFKNLTLIFYTIQTLVNIYLKKEAVGTTKSY